MPLLSLAGNAIKVRYSNISKCRYPEVLDFLGRYYYCEEPVSQALNLAPNGSLPRDARLMLAKRFDEDSSLIAVDESSDKVIAAVTASVMTPEIERDIYLSYRKMVEYHPNWAGLYRLHQELYREADRFQLVGCDRIFDIVNVAVMPQFRKFRIANELMSRVVSQAQARGDCQVALAYPTTTATFRILSRLGFETVTKVNVSQVKFNGRPIVDDPEVFSLVMGKVLRDDEHNSEFEMQ